MKLITVFTALLPMIFFTSCRGKGNSTFFMPVAQPGEFKLFYDPAYWSGQEIPKPNLKEWLSPGVKIRSAPGVACLFSGTDFVYGVSVCFPDRDGKVELEIQNILKFWNEHPEGRTESEEFGFSELGNGRLKVELNRDLFADCDEDWLILSGEPSLNRALKRISFPETNLLSVFSENSISRPHSPNAFVGFSVLAGPGRMKVLFHSKNRIHALNSLVLEIPGDVSILSNFFLEIQKKNSEVLGFCQKKSPILSEIFGGTNSPTGRFLEFHNSSQETICFQDFRMEIEGKEFSIQKGKAFLIPGETILRVESESILSGNEIPGFPWAELKKKGEWFLKTDSEQVVVLNRESSFQEGERFYSSEGDFYSLCGKQGFFESSDRLCMSPGAFAKSDDVDESNYCDLEKFQIEEVNFTGLFLGESINGKHKFLDLEYSGNINCNPNRLSLETGGKEYPIWVDVERIDPNSILTLGKPDWIQKRILLSRNDLSDLKFGVEFFIKDRFLKKKVLLSQENDILPILQKKNGLLLSLLFRNGIWIPHPSSKSEVFSDSIQNFHFMNPGAKTEVDEFFKKGNAELSELSWMGSYDAGVAIAADRFVELDSTKSTVKILEVLSGVKSYRFLIFLSAGKNVFSTSALVCFPNVDTWIVPELNLGSSGRIRILSLETNSIEDEFVWNPQGPGINSTSQKIRRSASKIRTLAGTSLWKNSGLSDLSERKQSCSQTEASPGFANRTVPFLFRETQTQSSAANPFLSWNLPKEAGIVLGGIQILSLPAGFSRTVTLGEFLSFWSQLKVEIFDFLNIPKESLSYWLPVGGEELVLIPGSSSILISAVYPNPILSSNEWFGICNRGNEPADIRSLEIRDSSSSSDRIVEYSFRFGTSRPSGWETYNPDPSGWIWNDRFLQVGECGYVLSPTFKNESVPFDSEHYRKIYTIDKTNTIGNGIGKNEGLDLFQEIQQTLVPIHSYGNQNSPFPFAIEAEQGELILLRENRVGDSVSDYEVRKKDLP
ncbi:hypothetical protein JWG45_16090 [Leptospira sp. 201903070]|uniref:Lamin tail domain-containing protein n=1 Tax=Leptospira ainlahdjerensis TaxID=2810033 RepID=A0ABS2UE56_9LEPT|nr:hypothetical protein [Leptospira ainlahdjerensis]MBM9578667.1 hypothetical protein [Leptospira ainlahdjerensis]